VLAGTNPDDLGAWDRTRVDLQAIERFITGASRGLVEVVSANEDNGKTKDIIQFVHQSVIDFLTRNQRLVKLDPTLGPSPVGASHARLASCCLAYIMQEELRSVAMDIALRAKSDQGDSDETDLTASYSFLQYSAKSILKHDEAAQAEGISQISLLRQFQKHKGFQILQSLHDEIVGQWFCLRGGQLIYAASLQRCYYLVRVLLELEADAACHNSTDIVKLLLEHGTDVNAQGGKYGTALQAAAGDYGSKDTAKLFLEHGADVNAQGGYFGTALQVAISQGRSDTVKLLCEHGADVNAQGGNYGTALQAAISRGNRQDVVALPRQYGAEKLPL
jgi:hypothetical protein